ncbi:HAD family hydrolase [Williamsia sp. CHRR-6]|uniref:HAD family hydrolase n=1 Tax=Williamsia sp. CHRR-6 TaxID=2835871 RepID=UPI001BD920DA|nr:HAD family hydrolase [Williamsia sp. CHRR-6]MBT0567597.1 HAD family hydrolase [Williamsia sp. CHRR-6]
MRRHRFGPPTLIASDVDGTLIDDDDTVRPITLRALANARAAGTPFVLATGRPPRWISQVAAQLDGVAEYAVCANGAIILDIVADRVLYSSTLAPDVLSVLAERAKELIPGCGLAAERVGEGAHDAVSPFISSADYEHAWLNPDHIEVGDHEVVAEPAVKLLIRKPGMTSTEMAARLRGELGHLVEVTFSTDNGLVELATPGVTKATGLQTLAQIASLSTASVIAFGDMPNDIEMLRWAGRGVAMANAHPAAKAAADEIATHNNNDGVGRVLARWFG